ncbi:MAG: CDP-alcohol phosphatidyltransferase family protein [Myxococcota bacterium]
MARLIPHLITGLRLAIAYPFFLAMRGDPSDVATLAALLFVLAIATDLADGRLARWLGTESSLGRSLDHSADCVFVVSGLLGAAMRGALPYWLPIAVLVAFLQYTVDSFLLQGRSGLRMSRLGRWNGILYFVPLAGDILVRLGLGGLAPVVLLLSWGLVLTTLLSMGLRAWGLVRSLRTAPGSPAEGTPGRSVH